MWTTRLPRNIPTHALEEGKSVVTYLLAHMADYDGDRNRTALMGESSGGNLAIGISLKLKKIMAPQRAASSAVIHLVIS